MADESIKPALDPIYYTDEYPREGCMLSISVQKNRCGLSVIAPGGKVIEGYAYVPYSEMPRMVDEWLSGRAPRLKG